MKVKGFSFPYDLPMIFSTIKQIYATRRKLRDLTLQELMEESVLSDQPAVTSRHQTEDLVKLYRLISWYYHRVLKENNPCFVRSLILYYHAKSCGLEVQLVIGFYKKDKIEGHAWIILNGEIFCDQESFVQEFTEILSW